MPKPVVLIIRDGWGLNDKQEGNAVAAADTTNTDYYKQNYPWTILDCSGEAVGLPEGYQGSSEVGHLNMGAGRIVVAGGETSGAAHAGWKGAKSGVLEATIDAMEGLGADRGRIRAVIGPTISQRLAPIPWPKTSTTPSRIKDTP